MTATARIVRLALFGGLLSATLIAAPTPASAAHPGANGRLAIACDDGLWTVDADGTDWVHVTAGEVLAPAWSPGGNFFAFSRRASATTVSLWTMKADGTEQYRRSYTATTDVDPEWSPDGGSVTFSSNKFFGTSSQYRLWTYRFDLLESFGEHNPAEDAHDPVYAPDGGTFAWVLRRAGEPQAIWMSEVDGFLSWTVATPPAGDRDEAPDIAPGGGRYLFVRVDDGVRSVWAVDSDGSDLVRLTDASVDVLSPRYSPDGTQVAYLARPAAGAGSTASYGLWTMGPDGTDKVKRADDLACDHLSWQPIPAFPLVDARFSIYRADIEWAYAEGITTGCTIERFCPTDTLRREQMASFLARALDLPAATSDHFTDDESSIHEADINRIAEAGITTGCGGTNYCPRQRITREQMASFLARVLDLPAATSDHFTDDESSIHEADINRIAEAGITTGCGGTNYCPRHPLLRGEMVALLHRASGD